MLKKPVNIALLTTSFPVNPGSTSGIFIQKLVENLPTSVNSTVITPCGTSANNSKKKYKLMCFRYAPWSWQLLAHRPGGIPVALKSSKLMCILLPIFLSSMFIACFRTALKVDVIHANWSVNGVIAGFVGFLLRKPVITTLRGEDATRARHSRLYSLFISICMHSNYKLVAVSESIYKLLCQQFPQHHNKVIFIPNGVDSELLSLPVNKIEHQKDFSLNLLTIGSLIPRKGIDTIIDALDLLSDTNKLSLTIIGEGEELDQLKKQIREKSLQDIVRFTGFVQKDNIANFLSSADIFILASYSEGRPNVVLESFASGVPVIATNIPGIQELIKDQENGLLFEAGNPENLAACIMKLIKNKDLRALYSKNGREFIYRNNLFWPRTGEHYAELYYQAINPKSNVCAE